MSVGAGDGEQTWLMAKEAGLQVPWRITTQMDAGSCNPLPAYVTSFPPFHVGQKV